MAIAIFIGIIAVLLLIRWLVGAVVDTGFEAIGAAWDKLFGKKGL